MSDASYNLVTEPWIPVRRLDGSSDEVSLRTAFEEAHLIAELRGDLPTQAAALLRLLVAILWRSLPFPRDPHQAWADLWWAGRFDVDLVTRYLAMYEKRFDLLSQTAPFSQVAGLTTAKGAFTSLSRLVADVPAGEQFFTTRARASLASMTLAEAARWLVHAQAFDPSGIKSGAVGDERVKGGKGYPIGQAWCGWLGLVLLEGQSLFETLLLNLPLDRTRREDTAVWERSPLGPGVEERGNVPVGPVDLLTWPSRRLRLQWEDGQVVGVLVANGDPLHPRNQHESESMSCWRQSQAQAKAQGLPHVLMPREHRVGQSVWRGLAGLLATAPTGEVSTGRRAHTLDWLGMLRDDDIIPADKVVRARTVGLIYGSNNSVIDDLVDDGLLLRSVVLADAELRQLAVDAVSDVELVARAVGRFAENLAIAAGRDPKSSFESARESMYSLMDPLYRRWVSALAAESDVAERRRVWQRILRSEALGLLRGLSRQAGSRALAGRIVVDAKGVERPVNAAVAERAALAAFRRHLVYAYRTDRKEPV